MSNESLILLWLQGPQNGKQQITETTSVVKSSRRSTSSAASTRRSTLSSRQSLESSRPSSAGSGRLSAALSDYLERPASAASSSSRKHRDRSIQRPPTGDEPRVLKRRVKQEKRSKSADFRRKRRGSFHESIPKSKDDLDPGIFTVVGRPNNPWGDENLKRNKSVPNLSHNNNRTVLQSTENLFREETLKSKSTPDLRKTEEEKPKLERKRSTKNIYIKSVRSSTKEETETTSHSESTTTSVSVVNKQEGEELLDNKPEVNGLIGDGKKLIRNQEEKEEEKEEEREVKEEEEVILNTESVTTESVSQAEDVVFLNKPNKISALDIGHLEKREPDSELQSTLDLQTQVQEFQKSCDNLLEDIQSIPVDRTPREKTVQPETQLTQQGLEKKLREEQFTREVVLHEKRQRREIVLSRFSSDLPTDLIDQGIEILKDFIKQLILEDKIRNIVSIKRFVSSTEIEYHSDQFEEEEEEEEINMYRRSLQETGLGLERHSSMPEMSRDEFLVKREEMKKKGIKRNNSLTNVSGTPKKRVIKTKVSSRLLQSTAASQGKQKSKIAYVPPAKRGDPVWTDQPLKNVDSGYSSQTFVKYYDDEPPRNIIHSANTIVDDHERFEWKPNSRRAYEEHRRSESQDDARYYDINNNYDHPDGPPENKYGSYENKYGSSPGNQNKKFPPEWSPKKFHRPQSDDEEDPRKLKTPFYTSGSPSLAKNRAYGESSRDGDFSYAPFTTFGSQGKVLSAFTSTSSVHESNTFKYVYTIDAELSYREYNKLMSIINMLQEQKKKWEDEVQEVRDKLEKTGKEKMQLAHNNHILRQSLEAANRAIKEINGKVQELKQTLVPLREENSNLREENDEIKSRMDLTKKDKITFLNEIQEYKKMQLVYEEKLNVKDLEMEDYKKSMHEKFRNLEDAYRNYRDDMEEKHQQLISEVEQLRQLNENLKRELEALRKENSNLKKDIGELQQRNERLENELRQRKNIDEELVTVAKEKQMLSANTKDLEELYRKEIEKASQEIERTRFEIDRYKDETRALEGENDQLKFDLETLENRIKDLESTNEMKENEKNIERQQNEIMKNEIDELKKQLQVLGALKQEKIMLNEEKERSKGQLENLQNQLIDLERAKRECFINEHENQRLKSELERLKHDMQDIDYLKREHASDSAENKKLKAELQHLRSQLGLLEDKQKFITSPYNDEIKSELENIRNQMRDLANKDQERKVELYTDELKGELESLRNQIKELDNMNRQPPPPVHVHPQPIYMAPPQQPNTVTQDTTNTIIKSEKERISERVIYIKDEYGNLRELKKDEIDMHENVEQQKSQMVNEDEISVASEIQVESAMPVDLMNDNDSIDIVTSSQEDLQNPRRLNGFLSSQSELQNGHKSDKNSTSSRPSSTDTYVLKSSEISRREREKSERSRSDGEFATQDRGGRSEKIGHRSNEEEEDATKAKQKQIEARIRRKREQRSDWALKTPDIHQLKRSSMEELDNEEQFENDNRRRRNRSRSAGGRSRSADPRSHRSLDRNFTNSLDRSASFKHAQKDRPISRGASPTGEQRQNRTQKRERGRSPNRRNREYTDYVQSYDKQRNNFSSDRKDTIVQKNQRYAVEITVDNRNISVERQQEITRLINDKQNVRTVKQNQDDSMSPTRRRRVKSGERRLSRERRRRMSDNYEDSSSEVDERKPRRKQPTKNRDNPIRSETYRDGNAFDASDMLAEAMRSRQEQAMTNKIGSVRRMEFKDNVRHSPANDILIAQQQQQQQKRREEELRKQQLLQQEQQKQQQLLQDKQKQQQLQDKQRQQKEYEHQLKQQQLLHQQQQQQQEQKQLLLRHQQLQQQQMQQQKQQQQKQQQRHQYEERRNTETIKYHTEKVMTSTHRSNTLPSQQKAPVKPKRMFELDRGYLTDSSKPARVQGKTVMSKSQTNLNDERSLEFDYRNKNSQQKHVQNLRADESIKLTLTPTLANKKHREDELYAKINKQNSQSYKSLTEQDMDQVNRMERARQKHLQKNARGQEERNIDSERSLHKSASQSSAKSVITMDGIPIERSGRDKGVRSVIQDASSVSVKNSFITEKEANAMFSKAVKHASSGVSQEKQKSRNTYETGGKGDYVRHSSWSHQDKQELRHHNKNQMSHEDWQRANTMPRNMKKQDENIQRKKIYKSSEALSSVEHQNRSYRDTKLHGEVQRRNKQTSRDPTHRLSAMSTDSLGGFSQITYTTVGDSNSRYDDYATQIDDDLSKRSPNNQYDRNQKYQDESDILRHAKSIPKGHSKFHCDKCRELNLRTPKGEPVRFCWERYYPISETTPRPSLQSLHRV